MILKLLNRHQDQIIFNFNLLSRYSKNQFTLDIPKEIINYINFMYIQVEKDILLLSKLSINPHLRLESKCMSKKCYERLEELIIKSECKSNRGHPLECCDPVHCYYCHTIFCCYNYLYNNTGGVCYSCGIHVCTKCINGGNGTMILKYECNRCIITKYRNVCKKKNKIYRNLLKKY